MNYLLTLFAGAIGLGIGGVVLNVFDSSELAGEQAAHARDNETNTRKLATLSEGAAKAASEAIAAHNTAAAHIAALDEQYHRERNSHEADNAKNRAAIADGTRRLRIAVANPSHGNTADSGTSAGGMGDGALDYAEVSPAVGRDLFAIADDADSDARAKVEYLQQYIRALQTAGIVAHGESPASHSR